MDKKLTWKQWAACLAMICCQPVAAATYSDSNDNLQMPFQATELADGQFPSDTQWYTIEVYGGKYWTATTSQVTCAPLTGQVADANCFCFVGNNTEGFHIYNRMLGAGYVICCASSNTHEPLTPVPESSAPSPATLKVSQNGDGYNFYYPGNQTACVNDLHGDGILTLWTSTSAPTGDGCRMYLKQVDVESIEPSQESGVPFCCTRISNGKFASYTKWYTMSIRSGKMLQAISDQVLCSATDTVKGSNLWCFTGNKTDGYTAYNYAFGTQYTAQVESSDNEALLQMLADGKQTSGGTATFMLSENSNGGYNFHFPNQQDVCWNDFGARGYIALWNSTSAPSDNGSCITFSQYDPSQLPAEEVADTTAWEPFSGEVVYLYMNDGCINAFPREYILTQTTSGNKVSILAKNGMKYTFAATDVDSISAIAPHDMPQMLSFKFNNKFNDMLLQDALGTFADPTHITVEVGGIGKRLIPSIKTSADDAEIYIGDSLQSSKHSSRRFTAPVTYTISMPGWRMLRKDQNGKYGMHPFGNEYQVKVTYLADKPTSEYGVPAIYITTDDGTMISSKTTYWAAKIRINGAGFMPDMEETAMQIKGRGNSSWAGTWGKSPYRIKFDTKQKPLGMKAGKNWNLIANSLQGSMTTNAIGSRVAEMVGAAAANHFVPVELYVNGNYRGAYNLTEKVGFSNNSIDLDDETNAVLLELDTYYDETYKFTTTLYKVPVNVKHPDFSSDETNLTLSVVSKHFNTLTNGLQRMKPVTDYADPVYLARYLMVNDLIFNLELTHPKSMYVYNENILSDSTRYIFGPVWDCDWGFGYQSSHNYFIADAETDFYNAPAAASTGKTFLKALRYNGGEEINKQYYRVWTDFMQNHLDDLLEYLDDYYAMTAKSYDHDNTVWSSGGSKSYAEITERSKQWLRKRAEYVYNYLSNTLGYANKGYLEPDVPDGIDIVHTEPQKRETPHGVYDMSGRLMGDSLDGLPAGIYIQNGRKVIKR